MKRKWCFLLAICVFASCVKRDRGERYSSEGRGKDASEKISILNNDPGSYQVGPSLINSKYIEGTPLRIIDGDTFVLLLDNNFDTRVRLNGIDCPENKQAFSQRAKKELSDLIFERQIVVYYEKKDGFGRVLGEVYIGNVNVNHEMVRRGMAWHYVKYSDDETLARLESEARSSRVGLWSEPNPVPPWEYRSK